MDQLTFGLNVMLLGFSVVIVILVFLSLVFSGFGLIFPVAKPGEREKEEKAPGETREVVVPKKEEEAPGGGAGARQLPVREDRGGEGVPREVVAAITAALAVYLDQPGYRLSIRKIQRGRQLTRWVL